MRTGLDGEVEEESKVPTTPHGIRRRFSEMGRVRVALEVGTHSPWMGRLLKELARIIHEAMRTGFMEVYFGSFSAVIEM